MKNLCGFVVNTCLRVGLIAGLAALGGAAVARAQVPDDDAITPGQLASMNPKFTHVGPKTAKNGMAHARFGIVNIDSPHQERSFS